MAGHNKREAWVTAALSDQDVSKALVLKESLRKSFTSRSIAVIVSPKISMKLRDMLSNEFDSVHLLEEDRNECGLKAEDFAKLFALTLQVFEKGVFLSSNMLVMRNADQVFETFNTLTFMENMDTSVFAFRPSMEMFRRLMDGLLAMNGNKGSLEKYLNNWRKNQWKDTQYLDKCYNRTVSFTGVMILGNERDISIVNFAEDPLVHLPNLSDENLQTFGILESISIKYWNEIYGHDVKPKVEAVLNGKTSSVPRSLTRKYEREPIAIVGMSCRYPGSNNLDEFWDLILNGLDAVRTPPDFRWTRDQSTRNRPDCRKTAAGFLNVPVDEFDAKFFGISPKEAVYMDPQHRLLHELVWEGLEDAGVDALKLRGSNTGVFMGSWTNDFKDILIQSGNKEFYRLYMGNSIGAAAARISFLLGLTGPSVATESGCSSAMVAVHLACRSLLLNESNMALACGVNLLLHPFDKDEMPMVISPSGRCKTFDAKADGFARAEGCGVLVLKRLSDAIRDNDYIRAVIRGSGLSQEGISRSMGTPTVHCEALAMQQALADSQVLPEEVSYVEAHGTGTVVGDPMEISAITKAYHSPERKDPLIIGSVKTNVGHTESCSGITGIMKVVLALEKETIPPHRNFETLNPSIDLTAIPATIPLEPVSWVKSANKTRIAGVSSFGITGTDAHAILEEAPATAAKKLCVPTLDRQCHILKISAKSEEALEELLQRYQDHLEKLNEGSFKDFLFTANAGRANFSHRAVLLAKDREEAVKCLAKRQVMRSEVGESDAGKICFLFTGQGSQFTGMAKDLHETSPVFRMHFDYCANFLKKAYNIDIEEALWPSELNGSVKADISRTIYSQTSIFCVEYALLKLWESWGIKPDFVLGHSLGEFAASVSAGILDVEDALKLVAERSRLIDGLPRGKMLVIKADKVSVDGMLKKFAGQNKSKILDYAALNSSQQTVVAGDSQVILEFSEYCASKNIKTIVLEATHAFHSKHMDPILDTYFKVANSAKDGASHKNENLPKYISGLRGKVVEREDVDAEYWVRHTRDPVDFLSASKAATELGCQIFIEVGPQPVLSALTMMNNEAVQTTCVPSLKKKADSDWNVILNSLGKLYLMGIDINWQGIDEFYDRKKIRIPHYPFQGKRHWPDLMAVTGNTIHPLLGTVIPNASSSKIYQNGINLRSIEFVKDHAIGDNVIFPGAGYLEMCLAAGHATVEGCVDSWRKPSRPMKVENLVIEAPLRLEETKTSQVQVVVDFVGETENSDWNDVTVKIYHRLESDVESVKWLSHATARFSPILTAEEKLVELDTEKIVAVRSSQSDDNKLITEVYEKLSSLGLKFGPMFQSLEKVWKVEGESESSCGLLAQVKIPAEDQNLLQYIVHPVIVDAMIQAIMLLKHSDKIKRKLHVPISIGKFIWVSSLEETDLCFVNAFDRKLEADSGSESDRSTCAVLLNQNGKLLALMSNVEFIDTTVKAVEAVLEQQACAMPDIWEESWRPKLGHMQHRIPYEILKDNSILPKEQFKPYNKASEEMEDTFLKLEKFVYYWVLNALYECGWNPEVDTTFTLKSLADELGVLEGHHLLLKYFLEILEAEGVVQKLGREQDLWAIRKVPISLEDARILVKSPLYTEELVKKFDPTRLIARVGEHLADVLRGKQSSLSVLFPESQKNWPSVAGFYEDYGSYFNILPLLEEISRSRVRQWNEMIREKGGEAGGKYVYRVLEVGAGTGVFTGQALKALFEEGIDFEYIYTDISPAFFSDAEKRFEKYAKHMKFKKLNIEEDPLAQGFIPEYYDLVIASDVIHATKNVVATLKRIKTLLRAGGSIDIMEQTQKNRIISFIFGIMDGFWVFQDEFRSNNHCTMSSDRWEAALETAGFQSTLIFPAFENRHGYITSVARAKDTVDRSSTPKSIVDTEKDAKTWIIFTLPHSKLGEQLKLKLMSEGRRTIEVIPESNSFTGTNDVLQVPTGKKDFTDLFRIITAGPAKNTEVEGIIYLWGLDRERREQAEILQPLLYIVQEMVESLKQKFLPRLYVVTEGVVPIGDNDLTRFHTSTLWGFVKVVRSEHTDMNGRCIGIRDEKNLTEKEVMEIFCELWVDDRESQVAFIDNFRYIPRFQPLKSNLQDLALPGGTDRFQLILPESKSISDLQFGPLDNFTLGDEEIEVQVKVTALNFRDILSVIKPTEEFKDMKIVGFDFSGVVKRVGSDVTKWKVGDLVFGVNMQGGALPSHTKLHQDMVARVPENMTLCESATLPAVFCTSYFCLIDVAKIKPTDTVLIHTASGGVGLSAIDIAKHVGAKIIATAGSKRKQNYLRSLGIEHIFHSRNTNFADEILKVTNGKGVDVVLNSLTSEGFKEATLRACAEGARFVEMSKLSIWKPEEVKKLRPDVEYTIVDVSKADHNESKRLTSQMEKYLTANIVNPIPYTRFDGVNIREALRFLQGAKHIGKVVCVMPEFKMERGEVSTFTPQFNDRSTYLITGGMGGIGFEVANWMTRKGARHILLGGRSPPNAMIQEKIAKANAANGSNLIYIQMDIGNYDECREVLDGTMRNRNLPPLRGVMHAAGTLSDGLILNHTDWSKFASTFNSKVNGTINLHRLTENCKLEHFVLFSSVASLFGSPGQANHSAGNCFEDAFAHYRYSMGLPATTINWGQWGQVGIATEVDLPGMKALSTLQGITALEHCLRSQRLQTCVLNVESFVLVGKLFPQIAVYLDEKIWKSARMSGTTLVLRSDEFWQEYDTKTTRDDKLSLMKSRLKSVLRYILKLDDDEVIDEATNFQEMGVDSLMFIEIKNALQTMFGDRLTVSASALRDCNNVLLLSDQLVKLIEGENSENAAKPTLEEVKELLREDAQLPTEISIEGRLPASTMSQIRNVLLTGATGSLGPYILRELCRLPQIEKVYCLLRPVARSNDTSVKDKLLQHLEKLCLLSEVDASKIHFVEGNVTKARLGIKADTLWSTLVQSVDAIFHCAIRADHIQYYRKRPVEDDLDVRTVNIGGLKNVLEFACDTKVKHIFHASSLLAVSTTDDEGRLSENWPDFEDYDELTWFAYPISKFVCEMLLKKAVERGIPCKIFRYPIISGHSETGRSSAVQHNHMMLRYFYIMKCGMMPSNPFPLALIPVDTCAEVSIKLFFDERASQSGIFNITHDKPILDQEFPSIAEELGYSVKIVDFDEFVKQLESEPEDSAYSMFKQIYTKNEDELMATYTAAKAARIWAEGRDNFWISEKITNLMPEYYQSLQSCLDILHKDLLFAKREGYFGKYGLEDIKKLE